MSLIQFILIPALLVLVVIYFRRFRTLLLDRLVVLLIGLAGIVLVLKPSLSMTLANWLGVGRGADMVIYLSLVGLGYFCLLLWSKLRDLDARLTEIARTQALKTGSAGPSAKS